MHVVFLTADQIAERYGRDAQRSYNAFASAPLAGQADFVLPPNSEGLTADEIYEAERREDMRADCLQHAVMTMPDVTDQAAILARAQAFFDWIEG